jgi:hypothetical protein
MMFYEEYMRKNPLFGGEHKDEYILKPPPVDRLYAIYGTRTRIRKAQAIESVLTAPARSHECRHQFGD